MPKSDQCQATTARLPCEKARRPSHGDSDGCLLTPRRIGMPWASRCWLPHLGERRQDLRFGWKWDVEDLETRKNMTVMVAGSLNVAWDIWKMNLKRCCYWRRAASRDGHPKAIHEEKYYNIMKPLVHFMAGFLLRLSDFASLILDMHLKLVL